jgi:hypothetical protein
VPAERAQAGGERRALALARRAAGIGLGRLGKEEEAIPLLEEARRLSREAGDLREEAEVLQTLAACRARLGDPRAEGDFQEAIALHRRERADEGQDRKARVGLAVLLLRSGRYGEAAVQLEEVRADAASRGDLGLQEVALAKLAVAALDRGRLDVAIRLAGQAADLALYLGDHNLILVNRCALADAWIRCGRAGRAVAVLRETLEMPLAKVEPENADYARMLLANAWLEAGGGDEAHVRALLEETLARCRERRKRRPWLMGLVIEMERRAPRKGGAARPGGGGVPGRAGRGARAGGRRDPHPRGAGRRCRAPEERGTGTALERAEEAGAPGRARAMPAFARARGRLQGGSAGAGGPGGGRGGVLRGGAAPAGPGGVRHRRPRGARRLPGAAGVRAAAAARPRGPAPRARPSLHALRHDPRAQLRAGAGGAPGGDPRPGAAGGQRPSGGMVLLREDARGRTRAASRCTSPATWRRRTVEDAEAYSRRIVEQAGEGRSLLALDAGPTPGSRTSPA